MRPRIKSYSQITETAAELMGIPKFEIKGEMEERLEELGIPKVAVLLYVNWADWNVLTHQELAGALGLSMTMVRSHLNKIKREFPWLFTLGRAL